MVSLPKSQNIKGFEWGLSKLWEKKSHIKYCFPVVSSIHFLASISICDFGRNHKLANVDKFAIMNNY